MFFIIAAMKIHVMGASCAGSTTLGMVLGNHLSYPYFDSDQYFWEKSDIPFTIRRDPELRNQMLLNDLAQQDNWILGGSVISWAPLWLNMFNLVVFLYIPPQLRLQRLKNREFERYGEKIYTDPQRHLLYLEFLEWAKGYEDPTSKRRSLHLHEDWLGKLTCPVLEIRGDTTVAQRMAVVLNKLSQINQTLSSGLV